ncbi:hypothetical protein F5Y05DRAFT_233158 [Hypoxylon sp. FL0543]|nr:hypothetical protein F5Y05DRAFT_233158 [Hypoxylon sp. FL0543]
MRSSSTSQLLVGLGLRLVGAGSNSSSSPRNKGSRGRRSEKVRPRDSYPTPQPDESPVSRGRCQHRRGWRRRPTSVCSATHPAGDQYEMELPPAPPSYVGPPRPKIVLQEPTPPTSPEESVSEKDHGEEPKSRRRGREESSLSHNHTKDDHEQGHVCIHHHHHHYHHHHVHYHSDGQKPSRHRGPSEHTFDAEEPPAQSHLRPGRRRSRRHSSPGTRPRSITVPAGPVAVPIVELPHEIPDTARLAARRKHNIKKNESPLSSTTPVASSQGSPGSIPKEKKERTRSSLHDWVGRILLR